MIPRRILTLLTAAGLSAIGVQSGSIDGIACNPISGSKLKPCPPIPGFPWTNFYQDFTKVKSLPRNWTLSNYATVNFGSNGAELTWNKKGDAPQMFTDFFLFGGRYDVVMRIAPGVGIITSAVLWSDVQDEIDWEFSGNQHGYKPFPPPDGMAAVQSNVFRLSGRGGVWPGEYKVMKPVEQFHKYSVEWDKGYVRWLLDDVIVRSMDLSNRGASSIPQTPMKLQLGMWDAGDPDNSPGVIAWGGGVTPANSGPYTAYIKSINITSSRPACRYLYRDNTGTWDSIAKIGSGGCYSLEKTNGKLQWKAPPSKWYKRAIAGVDPPAGFVLEDDFDNADDDDFEREFGIVNEARELRKRHHAGGLDEDNSKTVDVSEKRDVSFREVHLAIRSEDDDTAQDNGIGEEVSNDENEIEQEHGENSEEEDDEEYEYVTITSVELVSITSHLGSPTLEPVSDPHADEVQSVTDDDVGDSDNDGNGDNYSDSFGENEEQTGSPDEDTTATDAIDTTDQPPEKRDLHHDQHHRRNAPPFQARHFPTHQNAGHKPTRGGRGKTLPVQKPTRAVAAVGTAQPVERRDPAPATTAAAAAAAVTSVTTKPKDNFRTFFLPEDRQIAPAAARMLRLGKRLLIPSRRPTPTAQTKTWTVDGARVKTAEVRKPEATGMGWGRKYRPGWWSDAKGKGKKKGDGKDGKDGKSHEADERKPRETEAPEKVQLVRRHREQL